MSFFDWSGMKGLVQPTVDRSDPWSRKARSESVQKRRKVQEGYSTYEGGHLRDQRQIIAASRSSATDSNLAEGMNHPARDKPEKTSECGAVSWQRSGKW
jgi:hypothetical protein